jgi:predicted RNase H-like HicB family nuclease
MKRSILLTIRNWKEDKNFIAYVPELKIASQRKTREEAIKRVKEAVDLFIENTKRRGGS